MYVQVDAWNAQLMNQHGCCAVAESSAMIAKLTCVYPDPAANEWIMCRWTLAMRSFWSSMSIGFSYRHALNLNPLAKTHRKQDDDVQVDARNAQLLEQHVCCASVESPVMYEKDEPYFGPGLADAMQALYMQGQSRKTNEGNKMSMP